jgi:5'-nucleotidase
VVEKLDPRGRKYYWIAGTPIWQPGEGTDFAAVSQGMVSVTPLHLDLTDYRGLAEMGWIEDEIARLADAGGDG